MILVTMVLMLTVGLEIYVDVEREGCERTVQAIREGHRVSIRDNHGYAYEVERARCVLKRDGEAKETPTS